MPSAAIARAAISFGGASGARPTRSSGRCRRQLSSFCHKLSPLAQFITILCELEVLINFCQRRVICNSPTDGDSTATSEAGILPAPGSDAGSIVASAIDRSPAQMVSVGTQTATMHPAPGGIPPPPPLLLTKRVTAFLRTHLNDHIHDAVLTTAAGNLLAHASSLPATTLRRQCAVAASLWAFHNPGAPGARTNIAPPARNGEAGSSSGSSPAANDITPLDSYRPGAAVTVQLDTGAAFVIRQLACGMLLICMGGEEHLTKGGKGKGKAVAQGQGGSNNSTGATASQDDQTEDHPSPAAGNPNTPPGASSLTAGVQAIREAQGTTAPLSLLSEVDSVHSAAATSQGSGATASFRAPDYTPTNVLVMRRQVEELARVLDRALGSLHVPEAGIGAPGA